jgi:hypothetical protein
MFPLNSGEEVGPNQFLNQYDKIMIHIKLKTFPEVYLETDF